MHHRRTRHRVSRASSGRTFEVLTPEYRQSQQYVSDRDTACAYIVDDVAAILAGAKTREEFEKKIDTVLTAIDHKIKADFEARFGPMPMISAEQAAEDEAEFRMYNAAAKAEMLALWDMRMGRDS